MTIRPVVAIGLASAGIGVAFAVAAAPIAAAAPATSSATTGHQHLVRTSAIASPTGGYTAATGASSSISHGWVTSSSRQSTSATAPTSNTYVSSSDAVNTDGGVKHHWGSHHRH